MKETEERHLKILNLLNDKKRIKEEEDSIIFSLKEEISELEIILEEKRNLLTSLCPSLIKVYIEKGGKTSKGLKHEISKGDLDLIAKEIPSKNTGEQGIDKNTLWHLCSKKSTQWQNTEQNKIRIDKALAKIQKNIEYREVEEGLQFFYNSTLEEQIYKIKM